MGTRPVTKDATRSLMSHSLDGVQGEVQNRCLASQAWVRRHLRTTCRQVDKEAWPTSPPVTSEVTVRMLPLLLALMLFAPIRASAQDPTVVDSTHYRVVFENDQVRVLRITYGPREKSVMHYHPAGVAVFVTDSRGSFTLPDGQTVEFEQRAGDAVWAEAGTHLPENRDDEPLQVILVELKRPGTGTR